MDDIAREKNSIGMSLVGRLTSGMVHLNIG